MTKGQLEFEHAWRHFQLHAAQRVSVFNFFVASSGLLLSGLAYAVQAPAGMWALGAAAGLLLVLLSLVFWKLDQRTADLIKLAEDSLIRFEGAHLGTEYGLFASDAALRDDRKRWGLRSAWTYGRSFRALFASLALLGIVGSAMIGCRQLSRDSADRDDLRSRYLDLQPQELIAPRSVFADQVGLVPVPIEKIGTFEHKPRVIAVNDFSERTR